jgi:hypothetical protein
MQLNKLIYLRDTTLVGVVIGGALTWGVEWFRLHKERSTKATYAAIRSVLALDSYINGCAISLSDTCKEAFWPKDRDPTENFTLPEKFIIPQDVDWASLPSSLSYRILSIPQRDEEARAAVSYTGGVAGGDAARSTRDERFLPLALEATETAVLLRKDFKLKEPERREWDPVAIIQELTKREDKS